MKITQKIVIPFLFGISLLIGTFFYFNGLVSNSGSIPGFGLDPFFCMFVIHTNALKIFSGHFHDLANLPFFFPKQHTLAFSDPLLFHSVFYYLFYSITGIKDLSIRLMFFGFFILNWITSSIFFYYIKRKINVSLFVGWLFTFSLFFQVQSAHYQNLIVFPIFLTLIPFFVPTVPNILKFVLVFVGMLVMLTSNLYFFLYGLIIFFSLFLLFSFYHGKVFLKQTRYAILGFIMVMLFAYPLFDLYFSIKLDYPEIVGARSFEEKVSFSARPWDFFKVLYPPWIYSDFKKYFVSYEFERSNYSGLTGMFIFVYLSLPYFRFKKLKVLDPQIISMYLFSIGLFLVSGPLILPLLYKIASKIIPGLSEIRAVGRAGLIINISYAISTFIFLSRPYSKKIHTYIFLGLVSLFLIGERITVDFPKRFVAYHLPMNMEALELIKNQNLGEENQKSILVITETIEDFIRIPFYLSIEAGISSINGYSGYNPTEWNDTSMFFSKAPDCGKTIEKNEYLFDHANYVLIEKQSPIYNHCLGELKYFQIVANSEHLALLIKDNKITNAP